MGIDIRSRLEMSVSQERLKDFDGYRILGGGGRHGVPKTVQCDPWNVGANDRTVEGVGKHRTAYAFEYISVLASVQGDSV